MSEAKIQIYKGPAGGWGALRSVARQLLQHRIALKGARTLLSANQPDGFDCPGCAWPDREETGSFGFCENGVKAVAAEATADRATPEVVGRHTVTELRGWGDHELEGMGRLTEPMAYDAETDRYRRVSWDEAFATVAHHLNALPSPDAAIFYTSGRTSNEAAFLYQLFGREFGTNNFPDCSNMCHESSGVALNESVGVGKGTVTLEDFEKADAIFVIGQNPGTNHPRMLSELEKAAKRGCEIVVLNPLREPGLLKFLHPQHAVDMVIGKGTPIATMYLQPLVAGDFAVFTGLIKSVLERGEEILDRAFIETHTSGFETLAATVRETPWSLIEEQSGLSQAQIVMMADIYVRSKSVIACWAMGLTQNKHAVATIQQVVNLMLLRGNVGRPGAGLCPVRGHSNVQGDRTMGIYEKPSAAFLDSLDRVFGIRSPRKHGYDTVEAIAAMHEGKAKVFIAMGGNFAEATPDSAFTEDALRRCAVTAHVSTKLNRSHLITGREAYILPCLGRSEIDMREGKPQKVTVEDSMSMVLLASSMMNLSPRSPTPKHSFCACLPKKSACFSSMAAKSCNPIPIDSTLMQPMPGRGTAIGRRARRSPRR